MLELDPKSSARSMSSKSDSGDGGFLLIIGLIWAVSSCTHYERRVKELEQERPTLVEELQATKEKLEMLRRAQLKAEE
jgi:hypothetical protein